MKQRPHMKGANGFKRCLANHCRTYIKVSSKNKYYCTDCKNEIIKKTPNNL